MGFFLEEKLRELVNKNKENIIFEIIDANGMISFIKVGSLYNKCMNYKAKLSTYRNAVCVIYMNETEELLAIILACLSNGIVPLIRRCVDENDREAFCNELCVVLKIKKPDLVIVSSKSLLDICDEFKGIPICMYTNISETSEIYNIKDYSFIQFSSGTTSQPKGICLSEKSMEMNVKAVLEQINLNSSSVIMSCLTYSHILGFCTGFIWPIYAGCKCIIVSSQYISKKRGRLFSIIERNKVTFASMIFALIDLAIREVRDADLSSLRCLLIGGEKITKEKLEFLNRNLARYGVDKNVICNSYGMSECGFLAVQNYYDSERVCQIDKFEYVSVGFANGKDIEIRIISNGRIVEDGVLGEIGICSSQIAKKYIINHCEVETQFVCIDGKKYFLNKDIGFIKNGRLYVCDRIDNVLVYNGRKYLSQYLERELQEIRSKYIINKITFINLPDTINVVICYYQSDYNIKEEIEKEIREYVLSRFRIKIFDFYSQAISGIGDLQKFSVLQLINAYINSKIINLDACGGEMAYGKYYETIGVIKNVDENLIVRTVVGDLPIVISLHVVMPELDVNDLCRCVIKNKEVISIKRLLIDSVQLTKQEDGHNYVLSPFYTVSKEEFWMLHEQINNNDKNIISVALNMKYEEFYRVAEQLWNWDVLYPKVGSMIYFLYRDNVIVGTLDLQYALNDKLEPYRGHIRGGVISKYKNQRMESLFLMYSFDIAKMFGYKFIRLSSGKVDFSLKEILTGIEWKLVKRKKDSEDVYDVFF